MESLKSFKEYVKDNFYNELFFAVDKYIQEFPDKMVMNSKALDEVDQAELHDIVIKLVSIDDIPEDNISFFVAVEADIVIYQVKSYHNVGEDLVRQKFKIECSLKLGHDTCDLLVHEVSFYSKYDKKTNKIMTDQMIPIIYANEFEEVAAEFLNQYYPEALQQPMAVNPKKLASRMGLSVIDLHLSKTCTIFGQICFKDGFIKYYDKKERQFKFTHVSKKTVLVDPDIFFMRSFGSYNNTIVHECVHWYKHRKFFAFQNLYDSEVGGISCQVAERYKQRSEQWTAYDWMEWHASSLAPRILMPKRSTIQKIEELMEKYQNLLIDEDITELYEAVIYELADFFDVSKLAAKIRMIDLGYEDAHGILNYVDDHYIMNYAFKKGSLQKGETYTIGFPDAFMEMKTNSIFSDLLKNGHFLYVDSHFCLNDPKYILMDQDGVAYLSEYAAMNMHECCLAFEIDRVPNKYHGIPYYKKCVLYRDALVDTLLEVSYSDLPQNATIRERAMALERESKTCADIIRKLPATFCDSFVILMAMYDITEEKLAEAAQLSVRTIQRMKSNMHYSPKYKTIVAVCLGMHLHPLLSRELIKRSGVQMKQGFDEDIAYELLLNSGWKNSVSEANEELQTAGLRPLTKGED